MKILYEYRREVGCQYKYGIKLEDEIDGSFTIEFDTPQQAYNYKLYLKDLNDFDSAGLSLQDIIKLKTPC